MIELPHAVQQLLPGQQSQSKDTEQAKLTPGQTKKVLGFKKSPFSLGRSNSKVSTLENEEGVSKTQSIGGSVTAADGLANSPKVGANRHLAATGGKSADVDDKSFIPASVNKHDQPRHSSTVRPSNITQRSHLPISTSSVSVNKTQSSLYARSTAAIQDFGDEPTKKKVLIHHGDDSYQPTSGGRNKNTGLTPSNGAFASMPHGLGGVSHSGIGINNGHASEPEDEERDQVADLLSPAVSGAITLPLLTTLSTSSLQTKSNALDPHDQTASHPELNRVLSSQSKLPTSHSYQLDSYSCNVHPAGVPESSSMTSLVTQTQTEQSLTSRFLSFGKRMTKAPMVSAPGSRTTSMYMTTNNKEKDKEKLKSRQDSASKPSILSFGHGFMSTQTAATTGSVTNVATSANSRSINHAHMTSDSSTTSEANSVYKSTTLQAGMPLHHNQHSTAGYIDKTTGGALFNPAAGKKASSSAYDIRGPPQSNSSNPVPPFNRIFTLDDYYIIRRVGKGGFANVFLIRLKGSTGRYYALKAIKKSEVVRLKQDKQIMNEKNILLDLKHSLLVELYHTFQNPTHLFMVMEFVAGGDLFTFLRKSKMFPEPLAKFYICEVLIVLEYLHGKNVVYRDLKPENILLDSTGHIKLADFGFAKRLVTTTQSFCGTPDYIAAEIVAARSYTYTVDWWSFGVLVFELISGKTPFRSESSEGIYTNIQSGKIQWVPQVTGPIKDLVSGLLDQDPRRRLGARGAGEVKAMKWFADVQWDKFATRGITPPSIPSYLAPETIELEKSGKGPNGAVGQQTDYREMLQGKDDGKIGAVLAATNASEKVAKWDDPYGGVFKGF